MPDTDNWEVRRQAEDDIVDRDVGGAADEDFLGLYGLRGGIRGYRRSDEL